SINKRAPVTRAIHHRRDVVSKDFFGVHQDVLQRAVSAAAERGYWSPFPESARAYGESANDDGRASFEAYLDQEFPLKQSGAEGTVGSEVSPYGMELGIRYPKLSAETLIEQAEAALESWREAGPRMWVGVALELLHRINRRS